MVSRSRCDSPPPHSTAVCSTFEKQSTAAQIHDDEAAPALPSSLLAVVMACAPPLGYAALHTETEKLLGDAPTLMALSVFLMLGIVMMRVDFIDAVEEETEKEGLESTHNISLVPGWCWFILGCGVALFLALNGSIHYEHELVVAQMSMYATNLMHAMLRDIPMWTALASFLLFGAVVMYSDFVDAVKEESEKQGLRAMEESPAIGSGRCLLCLGSAFALFLAIVVASCQASMQTASLIFEEVLSYMMKELQPYVADLQGIFSPTITMLMLGDAPTWTALAVFLMLGAVVMRSDLVDAMKEEAEKEGYDFIDKFSLIFVGGCWLVLGCGIALTLAGAHRWHVSGHLSEEVGTFFLSAVLAIGLASTIVQREAYKKARSEKLSKL